MKYFSFNNESNDVFKLIVKKSNHLAKGKKRIELIHVPGRTGDLIVSDGSRENLNIEIQCYLDAVNDTLVNYINKIDEWLNDHEGYKPLVFHDGTKFLAVFTGQICTEKICDSLGELTLNFSAIPFDSEV